MGVEFTKDQLGPYREGVGPLKLYIDDQVVAEREIRTVTGHFALCGEGLCIGYDSGDAVSSLYAGSQFPFTGGTITKVVFDIADDAYVDLEAHPGCRNGSAPRLTPRHSPRRSRAARTGVSRGLPRRLATLMS